MFCVLCNKKTREGLFPFDLCQGTDHFNMKQSYKPRKVTTQTLLDRVGWRGTYSCQSRGWGTGRLSSIHRFKVPLFATLNTSFYLSLYTSYVKTQLLPTTGPQDSIANSLYSHEEQDSGEDCGQSRDDINAWRQWKDNPLGLVLCPVWSPP